MSAIEVSRIFAGHRAEVDTVCGEVKLWSYKPGILGGIGVKHDIYNETNKVVKYVTFTYAAIDNVGTEISVKDYRFTGPLGALEKETIETKNIFFNIEDQLHSVELKQIYVEYMDGSEEIISDNDIKRIDDEDSDYQSRIRQEKNRILNDKKDKGVTIWAGNTDEKECKKEKVGDIVFYIKDDILVGLESANPIKMLEIPSIGIKQIQIEDFDKLQVESIILPRDLKKFIHKYLMPQLSFFDFCLCKKVAKTLVIPKEIEFVEIFRTLLDHIDKIIFESPKHWSVSSKILSDSQELNNYIRSSHIMDANKTWLGKLFSKK